MTPKEIGRAADRLFQGVLSPNLAIKDQQNQEDFGIDYEVEYMLPQDRASGVLFKVQQKGAHALDVNAAGDMISYSKLEVPRMRYYLHELRIPAALVVVDVSKKAVYWLRLQGNPQVEVAYRKAVEDNQGTVTVHVPVRNKLPETLDDFLAEMGKGQDAVMVRYLTEVSSPRVLQAALGTLDFEETLKKTRAHADILRLEQVERHLRQRQLDAALAECRRIWDSDSETVELRVAAGLNLIRTEGMQLSQQRSVTTEQAYLARRLAITEQMRALTQPRAADDRLRVFADFLHHTAQMGILITRYAGHFALPPAGSTPDAAAFGALARMAKSQLVIDVLDHFAQAQGCLATLVHNGYIDMVPQVWSMLATETSVFIGLLRLDGRVVMADALVRWFDQTLHTAIQIAERLNDWTSLAFCVLQYVPMAPLEDRAAIEVRAEQARMLMEKIDAQERPPHLEVLEGQIRTMTAGPPIMTVEHEQEVMRRKRNGTGPILLS
jgi:hypothetical protein